MEQPQTNKFLIPLAIVIAGMFVAGAIYFGGGSGSLTARTPTTPTTTNIEIPAVTAEDHIVGSRDAEIVIIEYSDTECPFCKVFHNSMNEIVRTYGGQVAWVYRHFPIDQLHKKAIKEAEATECAAELGGNLVFWKYINRLFEVTNSNDSLDPAELPKIALFAGLNEQAFNSCLTSGRHNKFVLDSVAEAIDIGARGTPYSVIIAKSGEKVIINGAEPLAQVKSKIDALLR